MKNFKTFTSVALLSLLITILSKTLNFDYTYNRDFWWMLPLATYSHSGFDHIVGNLILILFAAPFIERYLGFFKTFLFFNVVAMLSSLAYVHLNYASAIHGASCGLFALLAAIPFTVKSISKKIIFTAASLVFFISNVASGSAALVYSILNPTGAVSIAYFAHVIAWGLGVSLFQLFKPSPTYQLTYWK